jgi:Arc/MetJ family transcription regulator
MRTTLEIDEKLLDDVMRIVGESNKGKAVNTAMAEFIRKRKLQDLKKLIGSQQLEDNWRELEELELQEMREQSR